MKIASAWSVALSGLEGAPVQVEAAVGSGLPKITLVGLPDSALYQARERVRAAISGAGYEFPKGILTINLAPANLPKNGSHYDLAIAAAVLAATEEVPAEAVMSTMFFGELGLDGKVRRVREILPAMLAASKAGFERVVVPQGQAREAALVPGLTIWPIAHLHNLVDVMHGRPIVLSPETIEAAVDEVREPPDFADVQGHSDGKWAMEVAAAGRHHVYLHGAPGVGKTMLASRLPSILPDLGHEDAIEVSALHSLAGQEMESGLVVRPPYSDPHHSSTMAALVGGGGREIRPGSISLAHRGVLFLDELRNRKCTSITRRSIMNTTKSQPGASARPARRTRAVVYPAFTPFEAGKPSRGTRPIHLYLRLSKYHKDKADAIERQRLDLTRKLALEGGWTVMGEYIDNDSASASAMRNRKGWRQLNQDIHDGKVSAVAFWKLDRTNRVAAKCIEWIGQCQQAGVYLVSHQDSADELNTATAGAKLVTGIKALLAEVETDSMSERQLAAKRHLAEAGFHHGGMVPLGWIAGPRLERVSQRSVGCAKRC